MLNKVQRHLLLLTNPLIKKKKIQQQIINVCYGLLLSKLEKSGLLYLQGLITPASNIKGVIYELWNVPFMPSISW